MRTEIIYEDKQLLVAYKPAGLATQSARVGQADMVSELKNYLKTGYLGVIHRLDQPVEGLLVFAKDKKTAAALTGQLTSGRLNKQYYAVICGRPGAEEGELVDWIYQDASRMARIGKPSDEPKSLKAMLQYRLKEEISTPEAICLMDIHIDTGRFHQIRAQMAHAGLPLLGDVKYGTDVSMALSSRLKVKNVALCARSVLFRHPVTGKECRFTVLPKGMVFQYFSSCIA